MNFIHNYINKIAVHFSRADFLLNGQENDQHFGPLQIIFLDNSYLTFEDNGDAESISASIKPIIFKNDNESNMEYWTEIILDNNPKWSELINTKLTNARLLQNTDNQIVGCRLYFDNKKSLTYYNYFDDAKIAFDNDSLLDSFVEFEKLKWVEIAIE